MVPGLLLLVSLTLLVFNLDVGSLLSSDDVLYVQMAREMVTSGDWLQPTWMGEVVFEKPPLLLWLLSLSGALFGWSEWAMRLPGVLAGLFTLWFALQLTREGLSDHPERSSSWSVALPCALCLSAVAFVFNIRRPITDPLLTVFALMTLWACVGVLVHQRRGLLLGVAIGLGVLSKSVAMGPVVLVVIVALVLARQIRTLLQSLGVAAALALPWHLWMLGVHGADFWDTYIGYHVVGRAGGALVGETGLGTYMDLAAQEDPVVSLMLLLGLVTGAVKAFKAPAGSVERRVGGICAGAAWLTLLVIHLASTRLFHYLLPVVPMAAVVTSVVVLSSSYKRVLTWGVVILCMFGFASGPVGHLSHPDYAPASRALAERHLQNLPSEAKLILWEAYDPALFWYARRDGQIWSEDEGFYEAQQSVDMMRRSGTVSRASEQGFRSLLEDGKAVIVIPEHRRHTFEGWARRSGLGERGKLVQEPRLGFQLLFLGLSP